MMTSDPTPNYEKALIPETLKLLKICKKLLKNGSIRSKYASRELIGQAIKTSQLIDNIRAKQKLSPHEKKDSTK